MRCYISVHWQWQILVCLTPLSSKQIHHCDSMKSTGVYCPISRATVNGDGIYFFVSIIIVIALTLCSLGNFSCFFVVCWFFSKFFQEYHLSVKQIGYRSGVRFVWPDLGPICLQRLSAEDTRNHVYGMLIRLNISKIISNRINVQFFHLPPSTKWIVQIFRVNISPLHHMQLITNWARVAF